MLSVSCEPPCPRHPFNRNLQSSARENARRRPEREGFLRRSLLFGLGFFGRDWRPSSFLREPLRLKTLPVCMECLLIGLILIQCLFGIALAESLALRAPRLADRLSE